MSQAAELPAGSTFCVRLLHPVSSDRAQVGDLLEAALVAPIELDGEVLMPARTTLSGRVRAVHKVGFGIRRERASLDLAFTMFHPRGREAVGFRARVSAVENARESVSKTGVVRGTLATEVPQTFISYRIFQLAFLNPIPNPGRHIWQSAFPFFPQPEIRLPTGTDLWLTLTDPLQLEPAGVWKAESPPALEPSMIPAQVLSKKGKPADVVNLVFLATEEELDEAFERSGWDQAREAGIRDVFRSARNVFEQSYHPNQPMSRMKLYDRYADRQYQRGLNTYTKRHHLRIWKTGDEVEGKPVWVGAATHDIGLRFLWRRFHMTHAIAPNIDLERAKVGIDLSFSGCVAEAGMIERTGMAGRIRNAEGSMMETDGAVLAMRLKRCDHPRVGNPDEAMRLAKSDMHFLKRMLRRQVLLCRGDLLRLNVIWSAVSFTKKAVVAIARPRGQRNPAEAMMIPNSLWSPGTEKVLSTSNVSVADSPLGIKGLVSTVNAPEFE
ncbi:MAG: LssY C-terminal domain-containing protein [Bryobacteraceae bacterium]|nr:LssY C-terminal domain-containing protein [Bryobacteraceae bacterium]